MVSFHAIIVLPLCAAAVHPAHSTANQLIHHPIRTIRKKFAFSSSVEEESQQTLTTRVGELAKSFETVLKGNGILPGEIDTAHLLKACRKFEAAMRSIGQKQSAKDLHNNIRKAEALSHAAPANRRKTMSSLLKFEKETGIHEPGALKDPSGAIGFLWIRRSLAFQYRMYSLVLESHEPTEAALEAYRSELQPYHGWALQKAYLAAIKTATPPKRKMMARIGGFRVQDFGEEEEKATKRDLQHLLLVWEPLLEKWKQTYHDLDLEDNRRV